MMDYLEPRLGQVSVDGDYATLAFERRLPHTREVIWQAITEREQLTRWYLTEARIDGRAGGSIDFYYLTPLKLHVTGGILTWDPPRVFEHEWNVEPRPELPKGEHSVIKWELSLEGDETVLKLTHRNLTRQTAQGFAPGIHAFLDRLEAQLNNTALPDWMRRAEEIRTSYPRRG